MTSRQGWAPLLNELRTLQLEWEQKVDQFRRKEAGWVQGVAAGIEIGRNRITEEAPMTPDKLDALLNDWERIGQRIPAHGTTEAQAIIAGMDHGIRLVVELVRHYLRKPAGSAESRKARPRHKAQPGLDH